MRHTDKAIASAIHPSRAYGMIDSPEFSEKEKRILQLWQAGKSVDEIVSMTYRGMTAELMQSNIGQPILPSVREHLDGLQARYKKWVVEFLNSVVEE